MAFISVVIPVYNAKQFLSDTVKSVLTQPYRDIEIVLVNDGSNDGSAELCDELANENDRIHVIHQKNAGVSVARNTGIEYILCNKKEQSYIAFLDADDMWCKNVITSSLVQELRDEDSDIVGFSSYKANYAATKMNILSEYKNEVVVFPIQYQTEIIWAKGHFGAHLYHIRVFEKNRIEFDPKCRLNEDVIFAAKMFFCSMKFSFKDIYIYIYRNNKMSATHMNNFTLKNAASIPNAWYDAANYFEMNDKISAQQKCAWRNFCLTTSSIRCLEMIRVLAEEGYSSKEIYRLFSEKKYFLNIENVAEHNLAEWQRSDLILYKKSYVEYCDYFSKKGKKNRIKKKLLSLNVVCFLTENVLYKITLE